MSHGYEVLACKFGKVPARQSDHIYYKFDIYRAEPVSYDLSLYFWLIRSDDRLVLVDCGWNHRRAVDRGYDVGGDPIELLRKFGVEPADVDQVVISHMHFDHAGNLDAFPNATFSIARAEYEYWTGAYAERTVVAHFIDPDDVNALRILHDEGRLDLVEDEKDIAPGIRVRPIGGHTPGQMITIVDSHAGRIVLASDAIHLYEEIELDRPYIDFCDITQVYAGYDLLKEFARDSNTTIVAGHDPSDMFKFRAIGADWVDVTAPSV